MFQVRLKNLREGVVILTLMAVSLVSFRIMFMGNKPPEFAPSDNPASDSDSLTTRTLTFLLLPVLNAWILLCPRTLSFDWSMNAIPLVESLFDPRIVFLLLFYSLLVYLFCHIKDSLNTQFVSQSLDTEVLSPYTKSVSNGNGYSHSTNNNHSSNNKHLMQRQSSSKHGDGHRQCSDEDAIYCPSAITSSSNSVLIIAISIIVFPFLPASNLFFYVGFVIAERVLYIPSMGFCIFIAHVFNIFYKRVLSSDVHKKAFVGGILVLIVLLSVKTWSRNTVWYSEENLYKSGLDVNPAKGILLIFIKHYFTYCNVLLLIFGRSV